jgi:hypothetical protein
MVDHTNPSTWIASVISSAAILGSMLGWAPAFGALVAAIWYIIKIYESATVQRWVHSRRVRRLARLKARVIMLEAQSQKPLPMPKNFEAD